MAVGIAIGTWRGWAAALARTSLVAALAAERERWILWLPVALGCGIAGYFALANEPARWVAPVGIAASTLLALLLRRSQGAVLLAAALGAVFAGAALAQWRTAMVAASVLERRWGPDEVTGRVVAIEIRPEGRRVVLDRVTLPGLAPAITVICTLGFIRGFRVFTEVYATTGGGPAGSTEVIMTHVYKIGFVEFDYGYAAAVSFLVFAFTAISTVAYLGWDRRRARGR